MIALTHMRWNNDTILAENVPEIDLFLGIFLKNKNLNKKSFSKKFKQKVAMTMTL